MLCRISNTKIQGLTIAIWAKKPIKYEYMMDLGVNYFGEFFNCIFLS